MKVGDRLFCMDTGWSGEITCLIPEGDPKIAVVKLDHPVDGKWWARINLGEVSPYQPN